MPWTPAEKILNARAVAENLLLYIEANQADALLWAHGSALKSLVRLETSIAEKNVPVYPCIQFLSDNSAESFQQTFIDGAYSAAFEITVQNPSPSELLAQARSYDKAVRSMIRNCTTFTTNTGAGANQSALLTIETGFDPQQMNKAATQFYQEWQVRATYTLTGE